MAKKIFPELRFPNSLDGYDEIVIDIVANVDSGKSSLCGILSHPRLRDATDLLINSKVSTSLKKCITETFDTTKFKTAINDILDDGNGSARTRVLALNHEQESGRTSSISYNYMIFDRTKPRPRVVSLVDLAGHEHYLKTTITGNVH